jgi:hypothetical protein
LGADGIVVGADCVVGVVAAVADDPGGGPDDADDPEGMPDDPADTGGVPDDPATLGAADVDPADDESLVAANVARGVPARPVEPPLALVAGTNGVALPSPAASI